MRSIPMVACLALTTALMLSSCSTETSVPRATPPAGISSPVASSPGPTSAGSMSAAPQPSTTAANPSTTPTVVVPTAWTAEAAWELCQAAWTKKDSSIDWSRFDTYNPQASGTDVSRNPIYVARYRTKTTPYDARDCLITGAPASYKIQLHPQLDSD